MSADHSRMRVDLVLWLGRHQEMIQAYAYAIARDFHVAEDVYQEVALVVAERWETLPADDGLFLWVKEVARRKALEARRRWRGPARALDGDLVDALVAALPHEPDPARATVAACLEQLAGDARTVVTSRYWEDLSCEAIATRIDRTVKSVYGILARSRLALADCIERSQERADAP